MSINTSTPAPKSSFLSNTGVRHNCGIVWKEIVSSGLARSSAKRARDPAGTRVAHSADNQTTANSMPTCN